MTYIKRAITDAALSRLRQDHALVLTGARQTGKTTFCENILPPYLKLPFTYISFDDPDERIRFLNSAIAILESLDTPLVILDEVQKIPALFDPLKYVLDKQARTKTGQKKHFILTGSSQLLLMKNIKESLAGRVALLNLYPFAFAEVSGKVSGIEGVPLLSAIWKEQNFPVKEEARLMALSPEKVRKLIQLRDEHQQWGGYPSVWQRKDGADKNNWLKDYRKTYIERDLSDVGQVAHTETFVLVQKLLCARTSQILSISEVARDAALSVNTVKRYINLLSMTFQCFLLRPYYENVGKRFVKSPKIYFSDVGLNRAILGEKSIDSGAAYENWVFAELIKWKQLQETEPDLYFYRTSGGMEIDFLIAKAGKLLPVEVKSSDKVNYADGKNIASFMHEHTKQSPVGIIIYRGRKITEVRKNIWAVPDWALFTA